MPHLTVLRVCQHCDVPDRVAVYSDAACDFDLRLDGRVVAHRCQPLTFAFEKLHLSDVAYDGLGEREGKDFPLEQRWNPKSVLLQFDLLPLVPADRQNDTFDGNQLLVTLVLRDERFRYDAGNFWVILG